MPQHGREDVHEDKWGGVQHSAFTPYFPTRMRTPFTNVPRLVASKEGAGASRYSHAKEGGGLLL